MCGILGVAIRGEKEPVSQDTLLAMMAAIQHRGPDGFGIYRDRWFGFGSARLSIIDLTSGDQPISNEDGTLWIVFNGEIFNYLELHPALEERGHRFNTNTDTEVILHLYEEYGPGCLQFLNGQFAFAIWDSVQRRLFLARDRVGIRPLFYTIEPDRFVFGSEIKAILAHPGIHAEIDPGALRETFTYWSPLSPHTIFRNIVELPPAHFLIVDAGIAQTPQRYWQLDFSEEKPARSAAETIDAFEHLLIDATKIRLRADVPVGAYLSGGLDSSITTALIRSCSSNRLDTFSIAFADPTYDESSYQRQMADFLNTEHHEIFCNEEDIGQIFPQVIWHAEAPVLRTSPAPMLLLSRLVRQHGFKVVMTGEGADEFLAGYDIFKEMKLRRFWAKDPSSQQRPRLFSTIYPDIRGLNASGAFVTAFFGQDLLDTNSAYYSHSIRWRNTARAQRFLANGDGSAETAKPSIPPGFERWNQLGQAQHLEITTFLSPYLLSSQGDRMAMAHGVEGRYPFLDYRVIEFCNRLPESMKMPVLIEKWILKQLGKKYLPDTIWQRKKRPYRAPIRRSFFTATPLEYVRELLSETSLSASGLFQPTAAAMLARKAAKSPSLSEVEEMALVGILSTQLVHRMFIRGDKPAFPPIPLSACKVIDRVAPVQPPQSGGVSYGH